MPRPSVRRALRLATLVAAGVLWAAISGAEIVTLTSGRTMSVRSHRLEDGQIILTLRGGGEIVCDAALVERIDPDEVPYPEPAADPVTAVLTPVPPGTPFSDLIGAAAARYGLDPALLASVIRTESNFDHRARSRKGAMGLMQLMPRTARQYAVDHPYEPAANIEAGARHLRGLLDHFELPLALAAYNAGEAAVRRYNGIPPFPETRQYVARIIRDLTRQQAAALVAASDQSAAQ